MNKNFDVYGLGNALVDMEFEVSPEFLEKMGIKTKAPGDKGIKRYINNK